MAHATTGRFLTIAIRAFSTILNSEANRGATYDQSADSSSKDREIEATAMTLTRTETYFVEVIYGYMFRDIWHVSADRAVKLNSGEVIVAEKGKNLLDEFRAENIPPNPLGIPDGRPAQYIEPNLGPGEYYPRIARPLDPTPFRMGGSPATNDYKESKARAQGQLAAILNQLSGIFRVVEPCNQNNGSYGPEIANVLIVASTEVEAHCKAILRDNGRQGKNTEDYVKICDPMRLNEYTVELLQYPWIQPFKPFGGWPVSKQFSQALPWYGAYNQVKHDRYSNYSSATLEHCISAVSAIAILLVAQFGSEGLTADQQAFFGFSERPNWSLEEHYYNCDIHTFVATAVNYLF